ncbi:hypothetical protein L7F22_029107 [Adiantum nelumboides]|nr:hypothetical protein [Adiantum nelumboides]
MRLDLLEGSKDFNASVAVTYIYTARPYKSCRMASARYPCSSRPWQPAQILVQLLLVFNTSSSVMLLHVSAQSKMVFAHYMLYSFLYSDDVAGFTREIALAKAYGIDGFALNTGVWNDVYQTRADYLYQAAAAANDFKLFFSADTSGKLTESHSRPHQDHAHPLRLLLQPAQGRWQAIHLYLRRPHHRHLPLHRCSQQLARWGFRRHSRKLLLRALLRDCRHPIRHLRRPRPVRLHSEWPPRLGYLRLALRQWRCVGCRGSSLHRLLLCCRQDLHGKRQPLVLQHLHRHQR